MSQASQPSSVISARLIGRNGAALMGCSRCGDQPINGLSAMARMFMAVGMAPRIDSGFRHGLLETAHCWSPASAAAVDEDAVNAWSGESKTIDRQTKRSGVRCFLYRIVVRVSQKISRHFEVAVRERPDAPRPGRAVQNIVGVECHNQNVTCCNGG